MTGPLVLAIVFTIACCFVAVYLIGETEIERYKAERDYRTLCRHEAARREARRRLSQPRSLP